MAQVRMWEALLMKGTFLERRRHPIRNWVFFLKVQEREDTCASWGSLPLYFS